MPFGKGLATVVLTAPPGVFESPVLALLIGARTGRVGGHLRGQERDTVAATKHGAGIGAVVHADTR